MNAPNFHLSLRLLFGLYNAVTHYGRGRAMQLKAICSGGLQPLQQQQIDSLMMESL